MFVLNPKPITMKKAFILLLTVFLSLYIFGQETEYNDVIHFKNGSTMTGKIIEKSPGIFIKLQTSDNNVYVYDYDDIDKITKTDGAQGQVYTGQEQQDPGPPSYIKQAGVEMSLDMFVGIEMSDGGEIFGMHGIFGVRFLPELFIGTGTGFDIYPNGAMVPLFVSIRSDFIRARVTPFIVTNLGYSWGWINDVEGSDWGGLMFEPGIGVRFNFAKYFGMNITTSYRLQKAQVFHSEYYYEYSGGNFYDSYREYRTDATYHFFVIKFGLSF